MLDGSLFSRDVLSIVFSDTFSMFFSYVLSLLSVMCSACFFSDVLSLFFSDIFSLISVMFQPVYQ